MPTWGEILVELRGAMQTHGPVAFDIVRRKYLAEVSKRTGRNTILYATKWTQSGADPSMVSITVEDVQGLMEVMHGLDGTKGLDLILHSPGGSPDAAEAIVQYLRSKFSSIRVIVPQAAMSAATMVACAANEIVMGKHSSLGPIDPQFIVTVPNGGSMVLPAQAILDQFDIAKAECQDPKLLGAWAPILPLYGPSLLVQCRNALQLAQELVSEWLCKWMFAGEPDAEARAKAIGEKLSDHSAYKSHGRPIHRDAAKAMGLKIVDLEADEVLRDNVLSVFHTATHVFNAGSAVKIIENQTGRAFVKNQQVIQQFMPAQMPQFVPLPQPAPPQPPAS